MDLGCLSHTALKAVPGLPGRLCRETANTSSDLALLGGREDFMGDSEGEVGEVLCWKCQRPQPAGKGGSEGWATLAPPPPLANTHPAQCNLPPGEPHSWWSRLDVAASWMRTDPDLCLPLCDSNLYVLRK